MSKQCGDTARFNRIRKQNTARRLKVRELQQKLAIAAADPAASLKIKPAKADLVEGPPVL
ncbi:MAG: hypothetical protein ABSB35_27380 [Bryobacteraceae bacterium]|jgi:hypothetical protein